MPATSLSLSLSLSLSRTRARRHRIFGEIYPLVFVDFFVGLAISRVRRLRVVAPLPEKMGSRDEDLLFQIMKSRVFQIAKLRFSSRATSRFSSRDLQIMKL